MAFSVTKSFLSAAVGLAHDRGMIRSPRDRVRDYMPPVLPLAAGRAARRAESLGEPQLLEPFETEHNREVTWEHLLRQTSDWEGTLWGKPEWADRPSGDPAEWRRRRRREPGAVYEYNDVRVNALALAALCRASQARQNSSFSTSLNLPHGVSTWCTLPIIAVL